MRTATLRRLALLTVTLCVPLGMPRAALGQSAASAPGTPPTGGSGALLDLARRDPAALRERVDSLFGQIVLHVGRPEAVRALGEAQRAGSAFERAWGDDFVSRQVEAFVSWSHGQRSVRVAAFRLRREGNRVLARDGAAAATVYWRASAALAREVPDTVSLAAALGNLGVAFQHLGEPDSARAHLEAARSLAGVAGDRRAVLNASGALALQALDEGALAEARQRFAETLALRGAIGDHRGAASDHNNLGLVAEESRDVAGARTHYRDALRVAEQHGLAEPAAAALTNLGNLAALAGDYRAALGDYQRALAHYRVLGHSLDEALVHRNIGLMQTRTGEYRDAIASFARADELYGSAGATAELLELREDLLQARLAAGDLAGAAAELQAAERIEENADADAGIAARVSLLRADVASELNDHAAAEEQYRKAEMLSARVGDEWGAAAALAARGFLSLRRGDAAVAERMLERAARRQEELGDAHAAAWTRVWTGLAQKHRGHTAAAGRTLRQAGDTLASLGDHVGTAAARGALAGLDGGAAGAETARLLRAALADLPVAAAPGIEADLRAALGRALLARGRTVEAARELGAAVATLESIAGRVGPEARRFDYLADKWTVYADLARATNASGDAAGAFRISERMRARMLLEQLQPDRQLAPGSASAREAAPRVPVAHRVAGFVRRIAAGLSRSELAATERDAPPVTEAVQFGALGEVRVAGVAAPPPTVTVTSEQIAPRLEASQAMLDYLVTDSTVLLFVVRRQGVNALELPVARHELKRMVEFARGIIRSSARAGDTTWKQVLEELNDRLVRPAEDAGLLQGVEQLVVVPHAELHYLPFAALLDSRQDRFLAERYLLTHAPSATLWLRLGDAAPRTSESGTGAPRARRPDRPTVLALAPLPAELPASAAEVRQLERLPGLRTRVATGRTASEHLFITSARRYDLLHLATRGTLDRRLPLFSAVELHPGNGHDGRLEVHEVGALRLAARLVVLSACETALGAGAHGDVPPGDDWIGLVQAFLRAGAGQVLATLWPVDDGSTARWMGTFYRAVADGRSEAEAVALAQRTALREKSMRHPYFWAGFTLSGGRTGQGGS